MEDEQYCLKWNNHQATLLTNLTCLMDTERLYDCLLSAEGKTIKSHQVVISACSPYLEGLLNDCRQPGLMPILVFSDLAYDELVALREYMYKGEVNIRQTALDSFLKAAHSLQIKGLADGGGGGEDQGGGGKRKAENDMNSRRRRRRESTESEDRHSTQSPVQAPVKKQNIFSNSSSNYENNQVKMEPVEQVSISHQAAPQIKAEQHEPPPETHDLTGADDDFDDDTGYDMAGTSQPDLSQDMSNWQMENSMNSEDFAAQAMAQQPGQSSQDGDSTKSNSDVESAKSKSKEPAKTSSDYDPGTCNHSASMRQQFSCPSFSSEDRQKIFDTFVALSEEERKKFILDNVEKCAQKRTRPTGLKRWYNFLEYKLNLGEQRLRVCKDFFLATLGISFEYVQFLQNPKSANIPIDSSFVPVQPKSLIPAEQIQSAKDYLDKLPISKLRGPEKRDFICKNMNLKQVYNMFAETEKAVFREPLKKNFFIMICENKL